MKRIFRDSYIKNHQSYRSSMEYLAFVITDLIYGDCQNGLIFTYPLKKVIKDKTINFFGKKNVYTPGIQDFIDEYFTCVSSKSNGEQAYASQTMLDAIEKSYSIADRVKDFPISDPDLCINDIKQNLNNVTHDYEHLMICSLVLDHYIKDTDYDYYKTKIFVALAKGEQDILLEVGDKASRTDRSTFLFPVRYFFKNDDLLNVFDCLNINTIGDLVSLPTSSILGTFVLYLSDILTALNFANTNDFTLNSVKNNLDDLFATTKEKDFHVLVDRYIYNNTLEEIGNNLNFTRERARQIIKHNGDKMKIHILDFGTYFSILFTKVSDGSLDLNELLNDDLYKNRLLLTLYYLNLVGDIDPDDFVHASDKISNSSQVFKKSNSFDSYIFNFKETTPYYKKSELDSLGSAALNIIKDEYNDHGNYVIVSTYKDSDIIKYFCDTYYPEGIHVTSKNTRDELQKIIEEHLGETIKIYNAGNLTGILTRKGYILAGRGIYKNKDFCPKLTDDLWNDIFEYIKTQSDLSIYYMTVYDAFKDRLEEVGINNLFLFKGLIDTHLPSNYHTKRDYFYNDETSNNESPYKQILSYIRSTDSSFTSAELTQKFPGVHKAILMNLLSVETRENGLISLSSGRFTYKDNIHIDEDATEELGSFIEDFLSKYKYDSVNCSIVYRNLKILRPNLLKSLGDFGKSASSLLSYLKVALPTKFIYTRTFISINKKSKASTVVSIVYDYLKTLDHFNAEDAIKFMDYNSIGRFYYYKVLDYACKTHVLVDEGEMIKKDKFIITPNNLNDIRSLLVVLTANGGEIDTRTFDAYSSLPEIRYKWNKYLLVGITRSYLSDSFEVINLNQGYKNANYKIRRKDYGRN